ncbi:YHS domain-containing (seleno)protein [uncultured Deefgea sp.]|uniref:YHS domain-containing (seleno)protein n=1 Tax=uncultured Deefgea sp. TaxID=1304914 RepID=UPI00261278BD|nr:YHS domain-containing (seleno)protein [uncultured Deefgea sp.]
MASVLIRSTALAILMGLSLSVAAFDASSNRPVNLNDKGLVLDGYDPVSYFSGRPMLGNKDYSVSYEGGTYYFASKENMAKFKANASQFAPKFGGFCAMGVAKSKKLDSDPMAWRIVDGYLFVLQTKEVQKSWLVDVSSNLKVATGEWATIKNIAPKGL